ncbi:MAG: membrane protein insertion efficiency factor YidD [Candidatus Neomarinimicrobiota bacterium]|nr:membrane protein insertion efficiency factor YidD [Candidatus Neomarinimicrobiota bacterium]
MSYIFVKIIRLYQIMLSPILGSNCRYHPTCSQYMIDAINEWGILKGGILGIKRIAKCHPLGSKGFDPIPKKMKGKENV